LDKIVKLNSKYLLKYSLPIKGLVTASRTLGKCGNEM